MLYADIRPAPIQQRVSNFILRYHDHYTEYRNGEYVRTVDYKYVVLQ